MLSENDIQYMRNAHFEIYDKRLKDATLIHVVEGEEEDAFGDPIEVEIRTEVKAVVTHLSAYTNVEKLGYFGYIFEDGDVKFDVDKQFYPITRDRPDYIEYEGVRYSVQYSKYKGIGERNRTEFIGRTTS